MGAALTSWHLSKPPYFDSSQKIAQYAIIWLIPVLGTALILNILGPEIRRRYPGWIPWLDFMVVSFFVSSATEAIETSGDYEHSASTDSSSTVSSDD